MSRRFVCDQSESGSHGTDERQPHRCVELHGIHAHRRIDILQARMLEFPKCVLGLPAHLIDNLLGQTNAPRLRETLKTRRDIHAVAEDVAGRMDDVAEVESDANLYSAVRLDNLIAFVQRALEIGGAGDGLNGAAEFDQESISDRFDFKALVSLEDRAQNSIVFRQQG